MVFFFKQKTAYEIYQCDWSSDVCSSDLAHDVENLYVTDGSFMPTGGSVPYTWTIYANAFRVADRIRSGL